MWNDNFNEIQIKIKFDETSTLLSLLTMTALEITADQRSNIGRNFAVIGKKSVLMIIMIGPILLCY